MSGNGSNVKAVLFDLDGTLVDTAADLVAALNLALSESGFAGQPLSAMRHVASHGSLALTLAALPAASETLQRQVQERLLYHYHDTNGCHATLFDGVRELLDGLLARNIAIGVITNKPARYTRVLLDCLGLTKQMHCIISGDTCTRCKPDAAPMYLGAMQSGALPSQVWYLGDAERDLLAAQAAGMSGIVALWGYIAKDEPVDSWPSFAQLQDPRSLLALIQASD
ncbi:MAG: HAD-IA family hydrolase [Shewanella sp.]|nr:HAD-IA family hydrolase [Shewanella sp.]MCF1430216.1 HAD-IA family hydrolase [Shewanella sp.]MCF1437719.1 HAD-IA family hydrolase [Shewanella sp.]MCF1459278.1 HAD-IA family hydrolase [Shewanella sp.]